MSARGSCVAAATALLLASGAARAGEALVVRADPAVVVLGAAAKARLVVEGAGAAAPVLSTTAGRIDGLHADGAGRFVATWNAPDERYPHVAIVSAVADGRAGWTAIPLVGFGVAVARSKPRTPIRVTIGDASFGPVIADARGEARVPVVVGPGVSFAYHREKPLDLHVPATLHVQLAAARAEARADTAAEIPLWVLAVAADGTPRRAAPVEVAVTQGELGPLAEIAPGTFAATWRLPAGPAGTATATARLRDEPGPSHAVSVERPAGPLARVAVAADPSSVQAGGGPVAVRVFLTDAAGNPVDVEPDLAASVGTASPLRRTAPGAWEGTVSVPEALGGARRSAVVARAGGVEARSEIALSPSAAARLVVSPPSVAVVADGSGEARVRVEIEDRFGNRLDDTAPAVQVTGRGSVSPEAQPGGAWLVRYRPARARQGATEVLSIRAGELAGEARLELTAPRRTLSVAPKLGLAASLAGMQAAYVGGEAAYRTRLLDGRLGGALELGTFVHERADVVPVGSGTVRVSGRARYVSLLLAARWRTEVGGRWIAWGDAGVGLAHVGAEVAAGTAPADGESGAALGVHAALGWGMQLGHGAPFVELRAARFGDPGLETLHGSLGVFTLGVGYRYEAY